MAMLTEGLLQCSNEITKDIDEEVQSTMLTS